MKRFLLNLLVIICLLGCIGIASTIESTYMREGVVVCVNGDTATVKDESGFLWNLKTDELQKGQKVSLKMQDNHTDIIKDDIVIDYELK